MGEAYKSCGERRLIVRLYNDTLAAA